MKIIDCSYKIFGNEKDEVFIDHHLFGPVVLSQQGFEWSLADPSSLPARFSPEQCKHNPIEILAFFNWMYPQPKYREHGRGITVISGEIIELNDVICLLDAKVRPIEPAF